MYSVGAINCLLLKKQWCIYSKNCTSNMLSPFSLNRFSDNGWYCKLNVRDTSSFFKDNLVDTMVLNYYF